MWEGELGNYKISPLESRKCEEITNYELQLYKDEKLKENEFLNYKKVTESGQSPTVEECEEKHRV